MSDNFEILCKNCSVHLWIGTSTYDKPQGWYIYNSKQHLDKLERFLMVHRGHELTFNDSEIIHNTCDYRTGFMGDLEDEDDKEKALRQIELQNNPNYWEWNKKIDVEPWDI